MSALSLLFSLSEIARKFFSSYRAVFGRFLYVFLWRVYISCIHTEPCFLYFPRIQRWIYLKVLKISMLMKNVFRSKPKRK